MGKINEVNYKKIKVSLDLNDIDQVVTEYGIGKTTARLIRRSTSFKNYLHLRKRNSGLYKKKIAVTQKGRAERVGVEKLRSRKELTALLEKYKLFLDSAEEHRLELAQRIMLANHARFIDRLKYLFGKKKW